MAVLPTLSSVKPIEYLYIPAHPNIFTTTIDNSRSINENAKGIIAQSSKSTTYQPILQTRNGILSIIFTEPNQELEIIR